MKKAIIFIFFVLQFINLQGQSVTISCNAGGNACFSVDPCLGSSNYFATINDGNFISGNGWTRTITWEPTLSASTNPVGQGTTLFTCTWNDQANSPARTIKVSVKYTKPGVADGNASDQKAVTIKYIAPISQMSVTGAITASPTNGGTVDVPCGSQSLTFSVPTPTTSPSVGVTYDWSFPAGWVGQSSSTSNTINGTTSTGSGGIVSVSAHRSDGSCYQNYSFTVTRPVVGTPTIAGVSAMCNGDYATLTGNSTNATSYSWTVTGALTKLYQSGSYVLLTASSSGYDGTVTLTTDNGCQQSATSLVKTIYVGTPQITNATVDWQPLAYPNYINNPGFLTITVNNATGSSTNWTLLNGSGNIYYAGQNQVSVYAYPFMRVEGVTSNQCGTGEARTFYVQDISNGYYRMASPNPATSIISSEILAMEALKKVTLVSAARPGIVRMYNANGSLNADTHRNNNILSFDTGNLPRGLYYLNFFFEGNRNYTEQIELN